jgi:hypothetical protein
MNIAVRALQTVNRFTWTVEIIYKHQPTNAVLVIAKYEIVEYSEEDAREHGASKFEEEIRNAIEEARP